MSRTCSTSRIQREVIQANGQSGSNQKSAWSCGTRSGWPTPGASSHEPARASPPAVRSSRPPGTAARRDGAGRRAGRPRPRPPRGPVARSPGPGPARRDQRGAGEADRDRARAGAQSLQDRAQPSLDDRAATVRRPTRTTAGPEGSRTPGRGPWPAPPPGAAPPTRRQARALRCAPGPAGRRLRGAGSAALDVDGPARVADVRLAGVGRRAGARDRAAVTQPGVGGR